MLGQLAITEDISLGGFIRRLTVQGLRNAFPQHAARIEALRRERRGATMQI